MYENLSPREYYSMFGKFTPAHERTLLDRNESVEEVKTRLNGMLEAIVPHDRLLENIEYLENIMTEVDPYILKMLEKLKNSMQTDANYLKENNIFLEAEINSSLSALS